MCNRLFVTAERYDYVGRLLKPGEAAHDYTDTEEEQSSSLDNAKVD